MQGCHNLQFVKDGVSVMCNKTGFSINVLDYIYCLSSMKLFKLQIVFYKEVKSEGKRASAMNIVL